MMPSQLPNLIVYSPMPPMRNGIADYTFELLLELRQLYRCRVVWPPGEVCAVPDGVEGVDGLMPDEARHHFGLPNNTPIVYQLGNNPDHVYMLPALARHPGLVVVHDPCLHHLLDCATLQRGDEAGYLAALCDEYGLTGSVIAEQFRLHRLREQEVFYRLPMLRHLLGPSRHILAHSRYAANRITIQRPDVAVHVVPHAVSIPEHIRGMSQQEARQHLAIPAEHFVVLALGFVTRAKRLDMVLRALAAAKPRLPPFVFVVGGELRPEELDLEGLARELGIEAQIIALGYMSEERFFSALKAADVLVNLRDPIGGETSGTLMRALGLGTCAIVPDRGPFAELPDTAVVKLEWKGNIIARLSDTLVYLAGAPDQRAAIGASAARIADDAFTPRNVAAGYDRAIRTMADDLPPPWASPVKRWISKRHVADTAKEITISPALTKIMASPFSEGCRTLAICSLLEVEELRGRVGRDLDQIEPNLPEFVLSRMRTIPARSFDLVVFAATDPSLDQAMPELFVQCNKLLAVGGQLVVGVPASRRTGRLSTHVGGRMLLAACGFEVDEMMLTAPEAIEGDASPQRWWRAFKRSDFIVRADRAVDLASI